MRYLWVLIVPLMFAQSGCDTSYPNEEMDVAGSNRTRPFAIVCEPAEAAPGEMVSVKMHYYEPDPDMHDVTWQVALDYDLGLYEVDEVERDIVTLDAVNAPTWDEQGFCTQTFTYRIPDDALLRASSQPEVITDELVLTLAREVMDLEADEPLTKADLDHSLDLIAAGDTPEDYIHDPEVRETWHWLSDLFACRIRFRASIDGSVRVDVTKTLTVRYSREISTVNVNLNPQMGMPLILVIPHPDVLFADHAQYEDDLQWYDMYPIGVSDPTLIPINREWTYYLATRLIYHDYLSPYEATPHREDYTVRWYHYGLTEAPEYALFTQDDGGEAEMGDLDGSARMIPPTTAAEHAFRVVLRVHDERLEWSNYAFAPGVSIEVGEFIFVEP
jgi:hypothetical protein